MEATEDQLFHQVLPPRLEDAGLEDCALPPDSIQEAFLKAAAAVKSRAAAILTSSDEEGESCVEDPWPETGEFPGPCVENVGGGEEKNGEKDCVDGLRELEIGDEKEKKNGDRDDDDGDEKRPVLVGGYV